MVIERRSYVLQQRSAIFEIGTVFGRFVWQLNNNNSSNNNNTRFIERRGAIDSSLLLKLYDFAVMQL